MADVSTRRNPAGTPKPQSAPALAPVVRATTTADLVVASIREAILAGRLQPGETLVERRLAEQLGVSKTPVREALIFLSAAGLVTGSPNRGCVVREPDAEEIRQAYELRGLIEPWAVARTVRYARDEGVEAAGVTLSEADELVALGAVAVLWARRPSWREEHAEHHEILAAARDGAAELAERLVRRHVRHSLQRLV
jgi:DNA-binding GntR family transcriptional regulator